MWAITRVRRVTGQGYVRSAPAGRGPATGRGLTHEPTRRLGGLLRSCRTTPARDTLPVFLDTGLALVTHDPTFAAINDRLQRGRDCLLDPTPIDVDVPSSGMVLLWGGTRGRVESRRGPGLFPQSRAPGLTFTGSGATLMVIRTDRCHCCRRTLPTSDFRHERLCHACADICTGQWSCQVRDKIEAETSPPNTQRPEPPAP